MPLRPGQLSPDLRAQVLTVVGLVVLLVVTGLGVGGFFLFRPAQQPEAAARIAADAFVNRVIAGNHGGAYDQLCVETRERVDRDDFISGVGARPAIHSYRLDRVEETGDGFLIGLTLADSDGTTGPLVLRVILDRGAWRICGDPLPT